MSRPILDSQINWGIPPDASIGAQSLWDRLNYYRMLAGKVVAPLVGMNYDEQSELANRNAPLGTPVIPASMPTSFRQIVGTPVKDLAKDYVTAAMRKILPSSAASTASTANVTTGDISKGTSLMSENHHELDAATGAVRSGISRRGFLKAVGGGAIATKALMSGAEEKIAPTIADAVLPEAAATPAAVSELGPSPLRVYERVGNRFVLTHEHNNPLFEGPPSEGRPEAAFRRIESYDPNHPELQMLAEPGRVLHPNILPSGEHVSGSPEYLNQAHDPYAARVLDWHKQADEHLARQPDIPDDIFNLPINDPRRLQWHKDNPVSPIDNMGPGLHPGLHSYIVEKPVRIRYIEHESNTQSLDQIHPEVSRLPYEHKGGALTHETQDPNEEPLSQVLYQGIPRLVGSGDTYDEALHKAESFLHDINIDPKDIKVGSGKKVVRWTLPNGDVIEIRERPSLRSVPK